jgi:hypothetical protein
LEADEAKERLNFHFDGIGNVDWDQSSMKRVEGVWWVQCAEPSLMNRKEGAWWVDDVNHFMLKRLQKAALGPEKVAH